MSHSLRHFILPSHQQRTLDELTLQLEPSAGDAETKRSAFWTMLIIATVLATVGVLADSAVTVIGAMLIAPMATPIMGIALAMVRRARTTAPLVVLLGVLTVFAIGVLLVQLMPDSYNVLANDQITSRTSPTLFDLIAALVTGLAGAIALSRRDVAAILPGVALAISLVPPIAVAGICVGTGHFEAALGAMLLFASNLVSLVLMGVAVFAVLSYMEQAAGSERGATRGARRVLAGMLILVTVPLAANTAMVALHATWLNRISDTAASWIKPVEGSEVVDVVNHGRDVDVEIRTPASNLRIADLTDELRSQVPGFLHIRVKTIRGEVMDDGRVDGR